MSTNGISDAAVTAWAEFSGVMVIDATFSAPGKPKTVYIFGGFSLGVGSPIMGVFKYYNRCDYIFEHNSQWFTHTTITSFNAAGVKEAGVPIDPSEGDAEYEVMGNIFYLSPANNAPAKMPPLVRVSGQPSNIAAETSSFDIDAWQWVSFGNQKVPFLWSGTIPSGWTSKPMPNPNFPKFVSINGTLLGMRDAGALKRFHVEILSVTFLGSAPPVQPTPAMTPNPKGKKQTMIDFDDKPSPSKNTRT